MTKRICRNVMLCSGALALVVAATMAMALSGQASAQVISACLTNKGDLKDVTVGGTPSCGGNETPISWNQQGPSGADGADGADGATGPQGPQGATGGGAPQEFLIGLGDLLLNGSEIALFADRDCVEMYGEGARWPTTEDVLKLPSASSFVFPDVSAQAWVQPSPMGFTHVEGSIPLIHDRSGLFGTKLKLGCGLISTGDLLQFWVSDSQEQHGPRILIGVSPSGPAPQQFFISRQIKFAGCQAEFPALCVGPLPVPSP